MLHSFTLISVQSNCHTANMGPGCNPGYTAHSCIKRGRHGEGRQLCVDLEPHNLIMTVCRRKLIQRSMGICIFFKPTKFFVSLKLNPLKVPQKRYKLYFAFYQINFSIILTAAHNIGVVVFCLIIFFKTYYNFFFFTESISNIKTDASIL